jgi:outer membrane receptor protein involved in Fe transport
MGEEMRKNKRSPVLFAKKSTLVATQVALALMGQLAHAQQQQPVQTAGRVERVEITGTRLPSITVEGPSPITTLNAQDIRMDGLTKTEDLLNNLPQVFVSQNSGMSNGTTGTANVNLRGLGPTRNLVLMNGRRLPAGSPQAGASSAATDLNQIPAPLIQRVELLTGGASAVYGSDAITGVVNFIMNDRFEGLQVDLYHSFYNHSQQNPNGIADIIAGRAATNPSQFVVPGDVGSDGTVNGISLMMGHNFADNKGNATVFFGYKKEAAVTWAARDFSACALNSGDVFTCGGSGTSFPGRFATNRGSAAPGTIFTIADAAGGVRLFNSSTDQYNFGPSNYFRRPSEQINFDTFAHLDINPKVRAYTELSAHDNRSDGQVAPGGIFASLRTIHFENPLLSTAEKNFIAAHNGGNPFAASGDTAVINIGRRNVEGGGRDNDFRHTSYRAVFGAKGDLDKAWSYDAFFSHGTVLYQQIARNFFSSTRINNALDVVAGPGGVPTCRSVVNGTDPNCVPYNIWALGGVNQAALNYLQTPGMQTGNTKLTQMSATAQADLGRYGLKMPTARDGLGFAFGVERRKERLTLETDTESATGDLSGSGGAAIGVQGSLDVDEWFTEMRLPLAQKMPLADLLSINGSYRRSNYSTGKNTETYGFGGEWAPVQNYRTRASYQHAVRHANLQELFQPQGNNLFAISGGGDPCGTNPITLRGPTATAGQCALSGVTAGQYGSFALVNPAGQYNFLQGGNPTLKPETANTVTVGLVMTPVRNFTASIDWWDIKIEDAIGNAPPSTLLQQCLSSGQFCSQIRRDAQGTLWQTDPGKIVATNLNLGSYHVNGIDIAASYTWRMGNLGGLGLNFIGSYLSQWEFEPLKGTGKFDCAGFYGPQCGAPNPTWKHKARASWATPWNLDLALTWRHIDAVKSESESTNALLAFQQDETDKVLGARDYFDVAAQWTISKTFTLRGGINNLLDKDPPIVSGGSADPSIFGNGNTFPGVYDTLGRLVFLNLTMKF